jgi:hypothetical protein
MAPKRPGNDALHNFVMSKSVTVSETLKFVSLLRLARALAAQVPACTDGHMQARCAAEQAPQAGTTRYMRLGTGQLALAVLRS